MARKSVFSGCCVGTGIPYQALGAPPMTHLGVVRGWLGADDVGLAFWRLQPTQPTRASPWTSTVDVSEE